MDLIPFSVSSLCLESYFIKITSRSKVIYWIIIGIILSFITLLPFIFVDVSVQARGYFQSEIERQSVYAPFQGKIVYTSIFNGNHIEKGDTLLVIESESIRAQQSSLMQRLNENRLSIHDIELLISPGFLENHDDQTELITPKYQAELVNFRSQQAIQHQKYLKKKSEHERNELLFNQQIIPEADFENSLFVLSSEKDNLSQISFYQKSLWQNDLTMRRNETVKLEAEIQQYREALSDRTILSPIDGEIIQSSDIQVGTIVNPGQKIAEITPDGELIATCFVKPADIGLIYEKQKVRIQVDALNYNEWGLLQGEIIDISDDLITEDGTMAYFRIKCKPENTFLSLKNGHRAEIKKGMSLNTRIVVIKRSLYNLLFDKADKWFNPYTFTQE